MNLQYFKTKYFIIFSANLKEDQVEKKTDQTTGVKLFDAIFHLIINFDITFFGCLFPFDLANQYHKRVPKTIKQAHMFKSIEYIIINICFDTVAQEQIVQQELGDLWKGEVYELGEHVAHHQHHA